jgi:hypothetical protein
MGGTEARLPVENRDGVGVTVENQPEMSVSGGLIQRGILGRLAQMMARGRPVNHAPRLMPLTGCRAFGAGVARDAVGGL